MAQLKRQRMSPNDRRTQLLQVAFKIFADQGLERAGHGDIAKLAGVSTATVFNYFPTRQDLTRAVLTELQGQVENIFKIVNQNDISIKGNVPALAAAFDFVIAQQPDMVKVFLRWSVSMTPETRPPYLELQDELLELLAKHLGTTDNPSRTDARLLLGGAMVFAMMRLDGSPEADVQKAVDRVADFFD